MISEDVETMNGGESGHITMWVSLSRNFLPVHGS